MFRPLLALALAIGTLALPAPVLAIPVPGENGRIVLVSGRTGANNDDSGARLHLQPVTFSNSGGAVSAPIVPAGGQYRHPTWSPDRTKIAFANGAADNNPVTQNFDIFVLDMVTGDIVQITPSDSLSADRPAWSPDGTRLAWEHQPVDANADRIIQVQSTSDLTPPISTTPINLTTAGGGTEGKPDWSPDSNTVYYAQEAAANDRDIVREPADNSGTPTTILGAGADGIDQYQPAVSPNGQEMCYTETGTGDVKKVSLPVPGAPVTINADAGSQYNCTYSPDGDKIAYVNGAFTAGALVMEESSGLQAGPDPLTDDAMNFDGNPSWAPDGRPLCPDTTITTQRNQPVTFDVECTDTGPAYEQSAVRDFNENQPGNGTVAQTIADDPYTYTPNQNFTGTDTFTVRSFDEFGFGGDTGTVTINVQAPAGGGGGGAGGTRPKCAGRTATIIGTSGKDNLIGTNGRDVIVGLGNNDRIRGGRGNDIICGGSGRDRISGGSGNDRIGGGSGNDSLSGDSGNDSLSGNSGNDSLSGNSGNDALNGGSGRDRLKGDSGRDRLRGGSGRDRLNGGSGRDRLNGGSSRDVCNGGRGRDRASRCERLSSIP